MNATTRVIVELEGSRPSIEEFRRALDTLTAEGIPETFEVEILHLEERDETSGVPYSERPVTYRVQLIAERAARGPGRG